MTSIREDSRLRQSLDNWITGHYGEDQMRDEIDPDAPWECPECGQVNDPTQERCSKCHTSRPQDAVADETEPEEPDIDEDDDEDEEDDDWEEDDDEDVDD